MRLLAHLLGQCLGQITVCYYADGFVEGTDFVRKSSEFRDHIGADGTFDVESGQLSPFVV